MNARAVWFWALFSSSVFGSEDAASGGSVYVVPDCGENSCNVIQEISTSNGLVAFALELSHAMIGAD